MKIINFIVFAFLFNSSYLLSVNDKVDATFIGYMMSNDGLGQIIPNLINVLNDKLSIKFVPTRPSMLENESEVVKSFSENYGTLENENILLFSEALWYPGGNHFDTSKLQAKLKIAYSMFESDAIHKNWVEILNNHFDMVVVPDKYYIGVYKNAGVNIPIFTIPLGLGNIELFKNNRKFKRNVKPFVFGSSASFWNHKNHELLLDAFIQQFGNNPKFKLKLHGKFGADSYQKIKNKIVNSKINNVELSTELFTRNDYIKFLESLNCYALLSKAEGFSLTPREAMLIGLPCILSNNTAHQTICSSGLVIPVKSEIKKPAHNIIFNENIGNNFNCDVKDVKEALLNAYNNYDKHLLLCKKRIAWAQKYDWNKLSLFFINLFKPKEIILGDKNLVTTDYLMTSSKVLYYKYMELKESYVQK
ncbi:MAG: glycosyltransferase [Candidatus Babeliales bacterium]|nr:glycosyltransferase [Candidatus Babeliales bacterium]